MYLGNVVSAGADIELDDRFTTHTLLSASRLVIREERKWPAVESTILRWSTSEPPQDHMIQKNGGGVQASPEVMEGAQVHFSEPRKMARGSGRCAILR